MRKSDCKRRHHYFVNHIPPNKIKDLIKFKPLIGLSKGYKMKRVSFVSVIIFVILVSTACGSSSSKSSSSTTGSTNKMATMTPAVELAVGTLRLEETSQAVDKKMAAQLLPYWQLIDELNASESTAPQEITAVVENIRAIMTTGQVQAIQNMKLT